MQDRSFQQRIGRIESLVQELEGVSDPVVKAAAKELVASVMDLNAAAFERVVQVAARYGDAGSRLMDGLMRDEAVSSLLILYGLHPQDFETRVRGALRNFEGVKLVSIEEGRIILRMESHERSESAVRQAVSIAAPDLVDLLIEGTGQTAFVPLSALSAAPANVLP
jgi:hypothetical protein